MQRIVCEICRKIIKKFFLTLKKKAELLVRKRELELTAEKQLKDSEAIERAAEEHRKIYNELRYCLLEF